MKARLLVGLVTVALGGLTSCSNILEENGVINNVAESGMGELRINLSTDATLNVSTKAISTESINIGDFVITATKDNKSVPLGNYSGFTEGKKAVPHGTYSNITATLNQMGDDVLKFDAPSFQGVHLDDVIISANQTTEIGTITATLTNSVISVDQSTFNTFKSKVNIDQLYVYAGPTKPTDTKKQFSLIINSGSSVTLNQQNVLYVKAEEANINLYLHGTLNNGTHTTVEWTTPIKGTEGTEAAKQYNVKYSLNEDNGSISLNIELDGNVIEVPITVEVNPYGSTTQENQSTDGGGE